MPQAEGGYVSLEGTGTNNNGQSIYQSTTEPTGPVSVFESVKRAIGQVVGANNAHDSDDLLNNSGRQPVIIGSRDRDKTGKTLNTKMPSAPAHTAEEARLLGTMPVDPMDDIELRSVQLQFPHARGSIVDSCDQRRIPTDKGDILVAIQGDTSKPAILTYHDLGLNYATSFAGFFNFPLMRGLLENFCVYHVTAPGQEEGAPTLPEDYIYPTMEELANQLQFVLSHFGLKSVIGFGIGAGANILARFALSHPDKVGAMCLINCVSTQSGWIEWGYQSFNARFLRTKGMTQGVIDYLMWHHFGRNPEERNHDLVQVYKQHFERGVNPTNLAMLINSYIHRNDLNISRTPPGTPGTEPSAATLKMPIMNITGALSPHVDDTVTFNGRLDPTNSTWMKISDCAMVLEEQPSKLAEAFRLFLQGEGYEEQERILAEKLKQHQPAARIRTNTRLCRETAINNNNESTPSTAKDALPSIQQQQQQDDSAMDNGNETVNNISSSYDTNNPDLLDNLKAGEEEEECSLNKHSIKGALTNAVATSNSTTTTTTTGQSKKIRITENPLPEPVSC